MQYDFQPVGGTVPLRAHCGLTRQGLLSGLFCRGLDVLSRSCDHPAQPQVFIPTVACVAFTVQAALGTKQQQQRHHLKSLHCFPADLKISPCHRKKRCILICHKVRDNERKSAGHSMASFCLRPLVPHNVAHLTYGVYQSVPPHMGLFLAEEHCAVVCFCAGEGLWRRASEKYSTVSDNGVKWKGNIVNGQTGLASNNGNCTKYMTSICLLWLVREW